MYLKISCDSLIESIFSRTYYPWALENRTLKVFYKHFNKWIWWPPNLTPDLLLLCRQMWVRASASLPVRSGPGAGSSGSEGSDTRLWPAAGPSPAGRSHLELGESRRPPAGEPEAEKTDTLIHNPTTSHTHSRATASRSRPDTAGNYCVWTRGSMRAFILTVGSFLWKKL